MIHIRPMTAADFDRFWPTFQAIVAARETYAFDPTLNQDQARQLWLESPLQTLVAEEDGQLLGSYYLKANAAGPGSHVSNCGYMVTEAARGRGVARALCEHSQQLAREQGFLAMQFNSVVSSNAAAVALWQKLGFAIVGRLPRAYRHAQLGLVDCLVMYKWLEQPQQPMLIGRKNIEAVVSRKRGR
ncbi:GNAT family N-acetyltransferase [Pseudomonas sp. P66]|jgi:ribosomal protein S18 acetylase RimI-like enzyme|uniref:GNAT family N-acetyltransferase n=1 Tax=Pseudomonas arcuscaelestis TaxID=2710591 RepID=A0ABS2BTS8_9PSED|nr:GNAT family N-acetyltransferase [Pseudomonas arcuscaelestis]MBM3104596.1 GNAT family N-acetyltransferase [Pseudomonas arcuscaelestis]MBM3112208.1 GNAT family N-acetyltransferase [Pseudomonas arcuscaelestis]MBM5456830.1 GNAT family N-acetyltransferase [Pseudomonas arcuscaelestis]